MMRLLGIPFVKSDGEAEATCAWLNENNYADGVLTDDGDVFLYGAKVVYKDFNISSNKHPTDYLQVFRLEDIESGLGLTRRNMIALALLLGCDYLPAGVPGVGKETAVKLSSSLPGVDLLDRFHEWKSSPDVQPRDLTSLEVALKRKAVNVPDFPNKAVIKEFLSPKIGSANVNIRWRCPDLEGAKEFFFRKLNWPKEYTEEKVLILVTDWQLAHMELPRSLLFPPVRIVKPRVRQGKEYYEIEWDTKDGTSKWPKTFANVKAKEIICKKFPTLVEGFESELAAKKCKGKTKKSQKKKTAPDEPGYLDDLLTKITSIDLNENVEIVGHSSDDRKDKFVSRNKPQGGAIAEQPWCEPHQDSENCAIEDNSLAGDLVDGTGDSRNSKEEESRANYFRIIRDEQTGVVADRLPQDHTPRKNNNILEESGELPRDYMPLKSSCEIASFINVDSPSILPNFNFSQCDLFELADGLSSPGVNEKTMLNLADMTVDQNFAGSDLGAVDDLLTDSFVASLQNATPVQYDSPSHSSQTFRSPHGDSDIVLFESNIPNGDMSTFRDDSSRDSLQCLNVTHGGQVSSNALGELDDKYNCKDSEEKSLVSDTPSSRERTSLASRLLKRFQTENQTNLAEKLRSISGEGEFIAGDEEMNKSTPIKHSEHRAKQGKMFAGEVVCKNEPFTNISNLAIGTKSSKTKPRDVIVLD